MRFLFKGKWRTALINTGPVYRGGEFIGAYSVAYDYSAVDTAIRENISLKNQLYQNSHGDDTFSELIGSHPKMKECKASSLRASKTDSSILLVGDTGTGKELFARAIHNSSPRKSKPFLAINCASIPENLIESILFGTTKGAFTGALEKDGLFYKADGGTVFLDELNSMPLESQAKLLRFLEERVVMKLGGSKEIPIEVRIISSINESPRSAIDNGHIREDLFYRLSVIQVHIPPLRERKEDIPELIKSFIEKYNQKFSKNVRGISAETLDYLIQYPWPGNVRQLKSCIESAMNFVDVKGMITIRDLPYYVLDHTQNTGEIFKETCSLSHKEFHSNPPIDSEDVYDAAKDDVIGDLNLNSIRKTNDEKEKEMIIQALQQCGGVITAAAEMLGISRQLLNYRLQKYHLK